MNSIALEYLMIKIFVKLESFVYKSMQVLDEHSVHYKCMNILIAEWLKCVYSNQCFNNEVKQYVADMLLLWNAF